MFDIEDGSAKFASQPARPEHVGTWDYLVASHDDAMRVSNQTAMAENYAEAYDQINKRIADATGAKDLPNPGRWIDTLDPGVNGDYGKTGRGYNPNIAWINRVSELQKAHPDALPWGDVIKEPRERAYGLMRSFRERKTALAEKAGMISGEDIPYLHNVPIARDFGAFFANLVSPRFDLAAAELVGGFAGSMRSLPDAAINIAGFGAGGEAKSLLKNMAANSMVNSVGQAPLSAIKQEDYRKAGLPYGWDAWLREVEGAASGGAAIDVAFRAPLRARRALSGEKGLGGILTDARSPEALPGPPVARPDISPETHAKAQAGDIAAQREIAEKTGAIEHPGVRGALDFAEMGGKIDEEALARLKSLNIDSGEGFAALENLMRGHDYVRLPTPLAEARWTPDRIGASELHGKSALLDAVLAEVEPKLRQQTRDLVDAGLPQLVTAAREAVAMEPAAGAEHIRQAVGKINEDLDGRIDDLAILHGQRGGPIAIAEAMRRSPDLVDGNISLATDLMRGARALSALDAPAFARVADGTAEPRLAALVADLVPPGKHLDVLDALMKAAPETAEEARQLIPSLTPRDPIPDGGTSIGGVDDLSGPEAKSQVKILTEELAPEIEAASAPIKAREAAAERIFVADQEIRALEARQDAELSKPDSEPVAEPAPRDASPDIVDQAIETGVQAAESMGLDRETVRAVAETAREQVMPRAAESASEPVEAVSDQPATEAIAQKRAEIRAAEAERLDADAAVTGKPSDLLYRFVLRSAEVQRMADVRRAINDALRMADRILPDGTKVAIETAELRDPVSGHLIDAFANPTNGDITLAAYAVNPAARLTHEALHTLVTRGHVSPAEVKLLAEAARESGAFPEEKEAKYKEAYAGRSGLDLLIEEEAAAHFIEQKLHEPRVSDPGEIGRIVDHVRTLITRIRNALSGYGFRTAEDVRAAILNGDMAKREAVAEWRRQLFGAAAEDEAMQDMLFSLSERRSIDELGYYSAVLEAAKGLKQAKGTPEQMWSQIVDAPGVRANEVIATGLHRKLLGDDGARAFERFTALRAQVDEARQAIVKDMPKLVREAGESNAAWSNRQTARRDEIDARIGQPVADLAAADTEVRNAAKANRQSVTKDEIVQFLQQNRVALKEVRRRPLDHQPNRAAELERRAQEAEARGDTVEAGRLWRESEIADIQDRDARLDTKWSSYSLDPSNPTYRETVLHLPAVPAEPFETWIQKFSQRAREIRSEESFREQWLRGEAPPDPGWNGLTPLRRPNVLFNSGHFDEPNITGHMMTSMTKHEGRPVFTLDQIQSDWGQKLRDGGVRDEAKIAELRKSADEAANDARGIVADATNFLRSNGMKGRNPAQELSEVVAKGDPDVSSQAKAYLDQWATVNDATRLSAELATAEASAPGHPLVNTTDQWTNTTLRRAVRQAVDAGADFIAVPHGDTVLSYNPGDEHGMRGFYGSRTSEGIVPKNLRKILEKLDKDAARPVKVEKLETPSGKRGYRGDTANEFDKSQTGFTLFPITDKVRETVVRDGQMLFALSPKSKRLKADGRAEYGTAMLSVRDGKEATVPLKNIRETFHNGNTYRSLHIGARPADVDKAGFILDPDGELVFEYPREYAGKMPGTIFDKGPRIFRDIDEWLHPYAKDVYVRSSKNKNDANLLRDGAHLGSKNHATGELEGGLSVSRRPEAYSYEYAYLVRGEVIGHGSDGEPLLRLSTAKPIGKIMRYSSLEARYERDRAARARGLGLSDEDLKLISTSVGTKIDWRYEVESKSSGHIDPAALREAGVAGIKYLDQGSRSAGDGTRNDVVFDDKLITITHKDGKPVSGGNLFALSDEPRFTNAGDEIRQLAEQDRRQAEELRSPLVADMAAVDIMNRMAELAAACRA